MPRGIPKGGRDLMAAGEVAKAFGVDVRTLKRWDDDGTLPAALRTEKGHRRWRRREVNAALAAARARANPAQVDGVYLARDLLANGGRP